MTKKAARAAVRQMRQLGDRPLLGDALAAGDITDSLAFTIAGWTRKLPAQMRAETTRRHLRTHLSGDRWQRAIGGGTLGGCGLRSGSARRCGPARGT